MSLAGIAKLGGGHAAKRILPWMWPVYVARSAFAAAGHVGDRLTPRQRERVLYLLRRSRGRPANLTAKQRDELKRLLEKVEPFGIVQAIAAELSPLPWPKAPASSRAAS
jgi:hypothetical protein